MTTSSNLQPYCRADIVIKNLNDPTDSKTLKFINRPSNQGGSTYLPLLKSYSGLSLEVGQDGLPSSGSGSIVISDTWESLGENRRVFDYFDRYTPINQTVTVYTAIETIGDLDDPSSWTTIYTGKVQSYNKDKETLNFAVSNNIVDIRKSVKVISSDMTTGGTYQVPEESIGKPLPIIFAETDKVTVPAYSIRRQVTAGTGMNGQYAYATTYADTFDYNSSSSSVLIKNRDGEYARAGTLTSPESGNTGGVSAVTSHGKTEFLCTYDFGTNNYLVSGAGWYCKGQNNGGITPTGKIKFTLYRHPGTATASTMTQWEELQTFEIDKSTYLTQVRGASDFWVYGSFPEPEVCGGTGLGSQFLETQFIYGIGVALTEYSGSSTTDFTSANSSSGTYFYETTDGGHWQTVTNPVPCTKLLTNGFVVSVGSGGTGDSNGFNYAYVQIEPDTNATSCNCTELDVAIAVEGICDDGSGNITGTPNAQIVRPDHIAKLLDYSWNGSAWAASGAFDTSTFSSTCNTVFTSGYKYYRKVTGFTEGDVSLLEILGSFVSETGCFLVPLSNGKLALWPWGAEGSVVRTFTDAEIIEIGSFDETDASTVLNNINIGYGQSFTNTFDENQATDQPQNLSGIISVNKNTSDYYYWLLANSETLYGKRNLEDKNFRFIGESTSATSMADYYARRHEHTHRTFPVTIPYFTNTDLKLMDIVDILTVHGPSYLGSSSEGRLPTYTGTEVDIFKGEYATEATRRRCQIIGLRNDYDGSFPKLTMTVREIKPRHRNDPTAANL